MSQIIDVVGLWRNDGVSDITGLTQGSVRWFDTTGEYDPTANDNFVGTSAALWRRISLRGADMLTIQLNTRVLALGALTEVAGGNLGVVAVGQAVNHTEPDFTHPGPVDALPSLIDTTTRPDSVLWAMGANNNTAYSPAFATNPFGANGVIHDGTVALGTLFNGVRHSALVQLGQRPVGVSVAGTIDIPLLVTGFETVWVAANSFIGTLTGGTGTTKLAGRLVAVLRKLTHEAETSTWAGSIP